MAEQKAQKVVVGMSGGVDSSVALLLLKEAGYKPVGVSLKYATWCAPRQKENVCCTEESLALAAKICRGLGVQHYVVDVGDDFRRGVIDYCVRELKNQRTPSPCVFCNPNLKFKKLVDFARKMGIDKVATGHYARVKFNAKTKFYELWKAKDMTKDQTYSLCFLPQKYLAKVIFPLGAMTKAQVYARASKEKGFEIFEKRAQSQDFCFVSGADWSDFVRQRVRPQAGEIRDGTGKILGTHQGLALYTIGQRRGLKLSGGPYYVVGKDIKNHYLIVSTGRRAGSRKRVILENIHWTGGEAGDGRVMAKIRSTQALRPGKLKIKTRRSGEIIFDHAVAGITPGQIAVFYRRGRCLGGGVIKS